MCRPLPSTIYTAFVVMVLDVSVENLSGMSGFPWSAFLPRCPPSHAFALIGDRLSCSGHSFLHLFVSCTSVTLS